MKRKILSREQLNQMDKEEPIEKVLEGQEENDLLQDELNRTRAMLFGRRTEKREPESDEQMQFEFNEIEAAAPAEDAEEIVTIKEHTRKVRNCGKRDLDLSKLPKEAYLII